MKTIKLIIIAAFVSFSMVTFANTDEISKISKVEPLVKESDGSQGGFFTANVSFYQAMQYSGLVRSMKQQLNSSLFTSYQRYYTVTVYHDDYIFYITGTYNQWSWFFRENNEVTKEQKSNL